MKYLDMMRRIAWNAKGEVVRVFLPRDPNCLLPVTDHCLRSPAGPAAGGMRAGGVMAWGPGAGKGRGGR